VKERSSNKKRKSESELEPAKRSPQQHDKQKHQSPNRSEKSSQSSSSTVTNTNRNENWLVPSGRTFNECFIQSNLINECPKHNDVPFCLQFHTKGFCTRGANCWLVHDDPRTLRLDRNFSLFIDKAYKRTTPSSTPTPQITSSN
jgi:hypothetical protein